MFSPDMLVCVSVKGIISGSISFIDERRSHLRAAWAPSERFEISPMLENDSEELALREARGIKAALQMWRLIA